MNQREKLKVVYVIEFLVDKGGTERIFTEKMNYLATQFGYDVSVVTITQHPEERNAFPLNEAVRQYDLHIPYYKQYHYRWPMRLWVKWQVNRQMRTALSRTVRELDPDILIGCGHFAADVLCRIPCRARKIIESHFVRSFTLSGMGQHRNLLSAAWHKLYRQRYLRTVERKADVVVTLSEGDAREWRRARRVEIIPNFSVMPIEEFSTVEVKRVVAVGRLEVEKGYDRLARIWQIVSARYPDWQLDLIGDGSMRHDVQQMIDAMGLSGSMQLRGTTDRISREYAWSSVCVLTSTYESFALVLLEALRHGVPCVAFDCPYGPATIVEDGRNGYLVEDGNIEEFADKLCKLLHDEELRKRFSVAAIERSMHFDVDVIMERWRQLFLKLAAQPS